MDNKQRFGRLREAYAEGRRGYPSECINYLAELIGQGAKVLDLGCGTGIATRQLADAGLDVIGSDSDEDMLIKAREYASPKITYVQECADNLPFEEGEFDAVTAFGAFHWFHDKTSVTEIRRVLRGGGVFVAVNKNDNDGIRRLYRKVLSEFADLPTSVKRGYNPPRTLEMNGFNDVTKRTFPVVETFTIDQAITHVQSRGTWNHIPTGAYSEAIRKLRENFERIARDGKINRSIEVAVVHGRK